VSVPRATLLTLPRPPKVELETVGEARFGEGGFLVLRRMELRTVQSEARSESFPYDVVDRRALDASVMVAHHRQDHRVYVWLRSCLRPPVALRDRHDGHARDTNLPPTLWEVPAGLIEPGESAAAAAARELGEELGFVVPESALVALGPPTLPAPGFIGELHHFFHVVVDPRARVEPGGDGSLVEASAEIAAVPLDVALAACRTGDIRDEKTELALRRLADELGGSS
jgi:8-oxo-dGTP pyrophosphatase MutT (NUDIX family)